MSGLRDSVAERAGTDANDAAAALVLIHGRGATARSMLELAPALAPPTVAVLAPTAPGETAMGGTWYPESFMAPRSRNEPWLGRSLERLDGVVEDLLAAGLAECSIFLVGFSQGACLALELLARRGRPLGGVAAWTGGLIGDALTPGELTGGLGGVPVFLGAGDPDFHVPWQRVEESAGILQGMGAEVTLERYPGMSHTINEREIAWVRRQVEALTKTQREASRSVGVESSG